MDFLIGIIVVILGIKYFAEHTIVGKLIWIIIKFFLQIVAFFIPPLARLFGFGRNSGIHGTAGFASKAEKDSILSRWNWDGLPLDKTRRKLAANLCQQHIMLCSPTGQGKTSNFLYPALLDPSPNSSYIVTDVSGEAYLDCSGYLLSKGFEIQRLNLMDNLQSHQYNPISYCQTETDIDKLTDLLVSAANQNSASAGSDSNFWTDSAKAVLSVLLKMIVNHPDPACRNLHNLRRLVTQLSIDKTNLNPFVSQYASEEAFEDYMGIISQNPKLVSDVLSTAKVSLKALGDPMLREVSAGSQIDFHRLRQVPTVLFVSYNVEDINYLRFFLSIFWTQALNSLTRVDLRNKDFLNVYCMLDEFQNLSRLPNFENSIAVLRKYKASLFLMLQGLDGLNIYGNAAKVITGNCKSKLFTGSLQHSDNELISKMLGNSTVRYENPNASELARDERAKGVREMGRPLMTADEIRRIPMENCLMFHGTNRPFMLDLKPYYKDKKLLKRTQNPPANLDYSLNRTSVKYIDLKESQSEVA